MDRTEAAALIETRANGGGEDSEIFKSHRRDVYIDEDDARARLRVEYRPDDTVVADSGFMPLTRGGFFLRGREEVETVVTDLYWVLVEVLYPGSMYLDEPWDRLPLLVEIEHDAPRGSMTSVATMGSIAGV